MFDLVLVSRRSPRTSVSPLSIRSDGGLRAVVAAIIVVHDRGSTRARLASQYVFKREQWDGNVEAGLVVTRALPNQILGSSCPSDA